MQKVICYNKLFCRIGGLSGEWEKQFESIFFCMKYIPADRSQQMVLWNIKSTSKRRVTENTENKSNRKNMHWWQSWSEILLFTYYCELKFPEKKKQTETSSQQQQWKHPTLLNILQGWWTHYNSCDCGKLGCCLLKVVLTCAIFNPLNSYLLPNSVLELAPLYQARSFWKQTLISTNSKAKNINKSHLRAVAELPTLL